MKRKLFTFVITALGTIFLFAGVASACHTTVSGTSQCSSGTPIVSWHIVNSESALTATGTLTSNKGGLSASSISLPKAGFVNISQSFAGLFTGTVTLTTNMTWSNGVHAVNSGQVSVGQTCIAPTTVTATTTLPATTVPVTTAGSGTTTIPVTTTLSVGTTTVTVSSAEPPVTVLGIQVERAQSNVQGLKKAAVVGTLPITGEGSARQIVIALILMTSGSLVMFAGRRKRITERL